MPIAAFRLPRRVDQFDPLRSLGDLRLARGHHLFLRRHGLGPRLIGFGLGLTFLSALVLYRDLLLLPRNLDRLRLGDPRLLDRAIRLDLGGVRLLLCGDPCLIRLALAFGLLARHLGRLFGTPHFQLALLLQPREFGVARDRERRAGRLQVLRLDLHARVLFDVVARLLAQLDLLGQLGETLGVKGIVGVEMLDRRLIQPGQRHAFQFQAVHRQIGGRDLLHLLDEIAALFVQLVHRHTRRDGSQRIDELALDQLLQHFRLHRPLAERLCRGRQRLAIGANADVELGAHVDAQPVERDERIAIAPLDREPHRVHVDRHRLVQHRQHQRAAVHHHLFTAEAGADKGDLLRRALVESRHDDADHEQRDQRHARVYGDVQQPGRGIGNLVHQSIQLVRRGVS